MNELITLIRGCEAMNDEEKSLWEEILPHMAETEKEKLKSILVWEKTELAKARMIHESKKIWLS